MNPTVSQTIPSYLRIHRGPRPEQGALPPSAADGLQQFWQAFGEATGWRVDDLRSRRGGELTLVPAVLPDGMSGIGEADAIPSVSRSAAARLARSAMRLATQLRQAEELIRRQAAELACRESATGADEQGRDLASRLEAVLADAASACHCEAAALYLLDDDTQFLIPRAVYGLPVDRLGASPRELRGSRGDLEALVQEVVLIERADAGGIDTWRFPEDFPAGICASVNDGDLPIGTLWLFSAEPQSFDERERATARMAASHLSAELGRAATAPPSPTIETAREAIGDAAQWQHRILPLSTELAPGWDADGMIESDRDWAIGWHHWDVLPDGHLTLSMAEAMDRSMGGAMTSASAKAALTAHSGYRHTPAQLIRRVGDTLWQANSGEELLSLLSLQIDPETGEGELATTGPIRALIASRRGYRPLVDGQADPLGTHIDPQPWVERFRMEPGEVLLVYGDGMVADGGDQRLLGESVREALRREDGSPLAAIRRELGSLPLRHERGAAVLVRQPLA